MRRVTLRICTPVRVRTVKSSTSAVLRLPSTKVIPSTVQRPNPPIRHFSLTERKSLMRSSMPMTLRKVPKRNTATEALVVTGLVVDGLAGFLLSMSDDDGGPFVIWFLLNACIIFIYIWNRPGEKENE